MFYFLSGKYDIHPSFIQEMLTDNRYKDEDIFGAIGYLKDNDSRKFHLNTLDIARCFYKGEPRGQWDPTQLIKNRDVLIIGSGPGARDHLAALEGFIKRHKPFVVALNIQQFLDDKLVDVHIACHPVRMLIDSEKHMQLPQKLIAPKSMLPQNVKEALANKEILDFGIKVQQDSFRFYQKHASIPIQLVLPYALAVATSGSAKQIFLAGFDGYDSDDPRQQESGKIFNIYQNSDWALPLTAITPTRYDLPCASVYALAK